MQKVKFSKITHILAYMHRNRKEAVYKSDISKALDITYSHVNNLLSLLESKGLIVGEKKSKCYFVELKREGKKAAEAANTLAKLED